MELSIIGFGVALALLLAGAAAGAPLIVGLFAAIPFGATAFATIGGSSPLIYTLFALLILASAALRVSVLRDLGIVLARMPLAWLLMALAIYAVAGAMLMPRLFAGKTTAFVPIEGIVTEVMLGPTSGNYTQTAYFLLGILVFFAFAILTLRRRMLEKMTVGLFAFAISETVLGWVDLAGKLAGVGDILEPIRTASYALLTDVEQSGFWRIAGGCSEAAAFAAFGLSALAFTYAYWRAANSWLALVLCVQLLLLLILSTSSTAYGGLGVLGLAAILPLLWGALHGRLRPLDWFLLAAGGGAVAALMGVVLYDEALFRPFTELFRTMVLEKASSVSGQERAYWNARSLKSFFDTYGLGVGLGSSRSSSWIVSALAQFGLIGSAMTVNAVRISSRVRSFCCTR